MHSPSFNNINDRLLPLSTISLYQSKSSAWTETTLVPGEPKKATLTTSSPKRFEVTALFPTLCVIVLSAGFALLILGWLLTHQYDTGNGVGLSTAIRTGSFVAEESSDGNGKVTHLRVLTFSSIASSLISLTSSLLVTLVAYRSAICWLRLSEGSSAENPTPIQYGILLRVLGSSSLLSTYQSLKYSARPKTRRARMPAFVREAIALSAIIYALSHAIGAVDLWLHATTGGVAALKEMPDPSASLQLSTNFDEGVCSGMPPWFKTPLSKCLGTETGWTEWGPDILTDGHNTMFNTSEATFSVVTLADEEDMALVVPAAHNDFASTSFTATSFGARASCKSLSRDCPIEKIGNSTMMRNCTGRLGWSVIPDDNLPSSTLFSLVDGEVGGGGGRGLWDFSNPWLDTPNPATMAMQLKWHVPLLSMHSVSNLTEDQLATITNNVSRYTYLYANCSLTYFNVSVRYTSANNSWRLLEATPSSASFASILWAPLLYQTISDRLTTEMFNIATRVPYPEAMAALDQTFGRLALGVVTGTFMQAEATDISRSFPITLSVYRAAPVLTLVALLILYSLLAVFILAFCILSKYPYVTIPGDMTASSKPEVRSALELAQTWLTEPLPVMSAMAPGNDGDDEKRSMAEDSLDMVRDGPEGEIRLGIGLRPDRARLDFGGAVRMSGLPTNDD